MEVATGTSTAVASAGEPTQAVPPSPPVKAPFHTRATTEAISRPMMACDGRFETGGGGTVLERCSVVTTGEAAGAVAGAASNI